MAVIQRWDVRNQQRGDQAEARRELYASGPAFARRAARTAVGRAVTAVFLFVCTGVLAAQDQVGLAIPAGLIGLYFVGASILWIAVYRRRRGRLAASEQ